MKHTWAWIATLAMIGCAHHDHEDGMKMNLTDAPAAVREGIKREAPSAQITSVEKEVENGMTIYEADVMQDGKKWELKVDEKGKLISKKMDDEKEDDGKKD